MTSCRAPKNTEEFEKYYQLRWQVLRKPWGQPLGSEQDEFEKQSFHRMIVDEQQQVLAIGRLQRSGQYEGQIRYMAVRKQFQGQGLGQQIIKVLEQLAIELGLKNITLNARENALGFYRKLAYQPQGDAYLLFGVIKHFSMGKVLTLSAKQPFEQSVKHSLEQARKLQTIWHDTIPVSKAMNIQISCYDKAKLITHCDPQFNKNLHNTMFAGSIYTLATLTGWGWVYLQLIEQGLFGDIVLADANMRYHAPIKGVAHGQVDVGDVAGSLAVLKDGKKAKILLIARLYCGDQVVATFTGSYFVIPKK